MNPIGRALLATLAALSTAVPVVAQAEEVATTTISAIERGEAQAMVYLEGAALEQTADGGGYLFSDGTGVIEIDLDTSSADAGLPLFELIGIEGTTAGNAIDVSRWAPLRIMTPAVIVEEPQVIEAFRGWIIAYDSQAPEPTE